MFDFVSMYFFIVCIINVVKDIYVVEGGYWDFGEGLGGFLMVWFGSFVVELRE